jgi:hypothetical protein
VTIRRLLDVLDKEIQMHQAAIRRLARRKAELVEAAAKARKKGTPHARRQ